MTRRQLKKLQKAKLKKLQFEKLKEIEALEVEDKELERKLKELRKKISQKKQTLEEAQKRLQELNQFETVVREGLKTSGWKTIDIKEELGNRKYTEGQKNYMRAIKTIESRLGKVAADLKMKYGSDDIEELANEYYIKELGEYSQEELKQIEEDFNKTHGYHIRLENATNPYSGIDFLSM